MIQFRPAKNTRIYAVSDLHESFFCHAANLTTNKAHHVDFHWGSGTGTEHSLNGEDWFGEMQIVHINVEYWSTIASTKAYTRNPDSMAMFGFFIKVILQQFFDLVKRV